MSKQSENVIRWRKRLKRKMIMAMGEKCQCCGYDACDEAMEFHHIDPSQKDFPLSKIRSNPRSLSLITEELKKCILLCSNCHKEVHYNIRQLPSDYAKLDENILISENEIRKNIKRQLSVIPKTPIDRRKIFLSKNELAELDGVTLTDEHIKYILSARDWYEEKQVVPTIREFAKHHGMDRAAKPLYDLFETGPMKRIAKYGGLPKPTGCV